MDVEIDEVVTELVVTEPNGSLTREEMKKIVQAVLEQVRAEQDRAAQKHKDTCVRNRAYAPEGGNE